MKKILKAFLKPMYAPIKRRLEEINNSLKSLQIHLNENVKDLHILKNISLLQAVHPKIISEFIPGEISKICPHDLLYAYASRESTSLWVDALSDELFELAICSMTLSPDDFLAIMLHALKMRNNKNALHYEKILYNCWFRHRYLYNDFGILEICDDFQKLSCWNEKASFAWLLCMFALLENNNAETTIKLLKQYNEKYMLRDVDAILPLANFAHINGFTNDDIKKSSILYEKLQKNIDDKLLESLFKEGSVAVVGNGPQQLNKGTGSKIDSYDVVIRFNRYKLSNDLSKDYGTKTTLWSRWGYSDMKSPVNFVDIPYIFTSENVWGGLFKPEEVNHLLNYEKEGKTILCEPEKTQIALFKKHRILYPSNGFKMLALVKKFNTQFSSNDVYGFTFNCDKDSRSHFTGHYYSSKTPLNELWHNMKQEADLIETIFHE